MARVRLPFRLITGVDGGLSVRSMGPPVAPPAVVLARADSAMTSVALSLSESSSRSTADAFCRFAPPRLSFSADDFFAAWRSFYFFSSLQFVYTWPMNMRLCLQHQEHSVEEAGSRTSARFVG